MQYCSVDHQKAHGPAHKFYCGLIKKAHEKLAREETALRNHTQDDMIMPANPFESCVGHFWGVFPTRSYMRARYDLVVNQLNIRTGEAVEAALANFLDMMRLCRGDNMGIRSQIPALYLRLGRDQDAFDFLKWYADVPGDYDWGDTDLPFLNVKGADALEPIDVQKSGLAMDLSFKVALLLLKSRLYVDVSMLEGFVQKLGDKAPHDRMEIAKEECMSDIMLNRRDIVDATEYAPILANLQQQMVQIYNNIKERNKFMIPAFEDPTKYSHSQLGAYSIGSESEAVMAYRHSWYSWAECGTVLQNILPLLKQA